MVVSINWSWVMVEDGPDQSDLCSGPGVHWEKRIVRWQFLIVPLSVHYQSFLLPLTTLHFIETSVISLVLFINKTLCAPSPRLPCESSSAVVISRPLVFSFIVLFRFTSPHLTASSQEPSLLIPPFQDRCLPLSPTTLEGHCPPHRQLPS